KTLQQGLDEFQKRNKKYFSEKPKSPKGEAFLKCHDIAHVVFGCDTTLYGEGLVKIWTTFGTTSSIRDVTNGYNDANAFELFKEYSIRHVLKNIFKLLITIPKVIYRAKKMKKPWSFTGYEKHLNTPIHEIRKEYHIKVFE
ncbi:MAG: Coq4 family protein, partial [Saprospiraceae bacterium]